MTSPPLKFEMEGKSTGNPLLQNGVFSSSLLFPVHILEDSISIFYPVTVFGVMNEKKLEIILAILVSWFVQTIGKDAQSKN